MSVQSEQALAERIVADNRYLVLATADADGLPWSSPVYYANHGLREFFWISRPEARHSQNIQQRPQIAVVVFDSTQPIGTGRAVYARATAGLVPAGSFDPALEHFSARCVADGDGPFSADSLRASGLMLYRALTYERSVLTGEGPDIRRPLP